MKTNVTYLDKYFHVNEKKKTVFCKLTCYIDLDNIFAGVYYPEINDYINSLEQEGIARLISDDDFTVLVYDIKGLATCVDKDIFDETKGKHIALSRCQRDAFKFAQYLHKDIKDIICKRMSESIARLNTYIVSDINTDNKINNHIENLIK